MERAEDPNQRPRGRWRRRLAALLLSLACAFLVLELIARARFGAPLAERLPILRIQADPDTGWRMVPSETHYTYQHAVRVNALGLRGPEVAPKRPGERRVLALGDSLIYGQGVADDATVPALLERRLNELDPKGATWTVVNGGHRAFDAAQEVALCASLADAVRPDVVVLFWFWNDVRERDVAATNARLSASGPIAFDTGEPVEGWAAARWRLKELLRRSALLMAAYDLRKARNAPAMPEWEVDAYLPKLDRHLARLREVARIHDFEVLFAVVPDANGLLQDHFTRAIDARAEERARAAGLDVCALHPPLAELARERGAPPVLPYDGHYDEEGNRAIAWAAADCLLGR